MVAAYVLAGELKRANGDHTVAFRKYHERLSGFIAAKQKAAVKFASFFAPRSRFGMFLGNQVMRLMAIRVLQSSPSGARSETRSSRLLRTRRDAKHRFLSPRLPLTRTISEEGTATLPYQQTRKHRSRTGRDRRIQASTRWHAVLLFSRKCDCANIATRR